MGVLLGSTITFAAATGASSVSGYVRIASAHGTDGNRIQVYGNATKRVLRAG